MITVEIAGIPIAIDNHFGLLELICEPYLTEKEPFFTVKVSADDMIQQDGSISAYSETLCVYRKIALQMHNYDGFLMHAAVIDVDGQGVAFAAASGTGKTTRVRLWQNAMGDRVKIVNGDKPILRFINGSLYAFGTPWMGKEKLGENTSVPLKYVCFLERSKDVSLTRLTLDNVIPRLFRQVLVPNNKTQMEQFMVLLQRFVIDVPFFLLKCNKDIEQPKLIWEEMKSLS